mgnify:CR=1 FL=1
MLETCRPMDIEARSFEIITELLGDRKLDPENAPVIKRAIHTTADFDYADNLVFSPHAVQAGLEALRSGCDIVTDTQMAKAGINKTILASLGGEVHCFMSDPDVAGEAKSRGVTRAWVSMEKAAQLKKPCIFAIGNAPTALVSLDALMAAPLEDLESNQGFGSRSKKKDSDSSGGSVRALSIRAFFDDPNNRALIERLRAAGLNFGSKPLSNVDAASLPLSGKIFVFTGTLQSMGRSKAKEIVESLGGRSASDVSKSTDFLVSDGKIDGSKAAKAREYGTRVLSENEFLKMVEDARGKLSFSADKSGTSTESAIPEKRPSEILSTVEKSAQTRENTETDSNTNGRDNLQTGNFAASSGGKSLPSENREESEVRFLAHAAKKSEDGKVSDCESDSQLGLALHSESGRAGQNADGLSDRNIKESAGESTPKKPGKHKNVPPESGQMSLGI